MDWRPAVGLTEAHRGSVVERVLMHTVLDLSVERHNEAVRDSAR